MANLLTLSRIFLILPIAGLLMADNTSARWLAFILVVVAALTDFFDGWLARRLNQTSALGAALDPIADKLLTATLVVLLIMDETLQGIHMIFALAILLRELWVAGLREALAGKLTLPVTGLAKWKTTVQFLAFGLLIMPQLSISREAGIFFLWAAAILTVWTGAAYTRSALPHLRRDAE